jgi:hypothetical protein
MEKTHACRSIRPAVVATALLAGATVMVGPATEAHAQDVNPDGKGIAGGALLGAEIVTITESLAGVRPPWAYAVGAIAGAGAGATGGYFIEHASFSDNGRVPTYMLAGGLALIIPAVVLALNATRYMPEEGATEDKTPPPGPPAEPGTPAGGVITPGTESAPAAAPSPPAPAVGTPPPPAPPPPPQSLFDVHQGMFRVGVPVPDVRPVFSLVEQRQYGVQAQTELRMPVVHVAFCTSPSPRCLSPLVPFRASLV